MGMRAGTSFGQAGGGVAAWAENLSKIYGTGQTRVRALNWVDVAFAQGEFTAIMGPSGSGKSTLMHCIAGLDTPSGGAVWVGGSELTGLGDRALTELRRDRIGFIFQSFNLVPTLSAAENITLPMEIAGRSPDPTWLDQVIDTVGLRDRLTHRPAQLSGGQQQRVACARALAGRPELIFADEPTGNLDSRAAVDVLGFLRRTVDELGQTIVMVTHDPAAAAHADRVLFLSDGRIVRELRAPTADGVLEMMKTLDHRGTATPRNAPAPTDTSGVLDRSYGVGAPTHHGTPADDAGGQRASQRPLPVDGPDIDGRGAQVSAPAEGVRLARAWRRALEHRDELDAILLELAASRDHAPQSPTGRRDSPHPMTDTPSARRDASPGMELAAERTRRVAAEAASREAIEQADQLRTELAGARAAAAAALELAVARAEQQLSQTHGALERWQAEIDAARRDQELSQTSGRG